MLTARVGALRGGTAYTVDCARAEGRPLRVVQLQGEGKPDPADTRAWLARQGAATLNVAGPRESQDPGIGAEARRWLDRLLAELNRAGALAPTGSAVSR